VSTGSYVDHILCRWSVAAPDLRRTIRTIRTIPRSLTPPFLRIVRILRHPGMLVEDSGQRCALLGTVTDEPSWPRTVVPPSCSFNTRIILDGPIPLPVQMGQYRAFFAIFECCGIAPIGPEYGKNRSKRASISQNNAKHGAKKTTEGQKTAKVLYGTGLTPRGLAGREIAELLTRPPSSIVRLYRTALNAVHCGRVNHATALTP
jgi:hypothetical protein